MQNAADDSFDSLAALELTGDDRELLVELIDLFTEQAAPLLLEIREAVGRSDGQLLARAAHKLKGSLSALSAQPAWECTHQLEEMGRSGDLTNAPAAGAALDWEMARLALALAAFKNEN